MSSIPPIPVSPPVFDIGQLSQEQLRQLAAARVSIRKVRRAVSIANFDGWAVGIFAGLTFLLGITSLTGVLMGLSMGLIALVELRAAARLRQLESPAARTLGINQLALAMVLICYASWSIYCELTGKGLMAGMMAEARSVDPQAAQMLRGTEDIVRLIALCLYGGLIIVAIGAQGGLALYYFSRAQHVETYLRQTPTWIIQLQKTGVTL